MMQAYPLNWPTDWPRTPRYQRGAGPNQMPASRARQLLLRDLEKMGATDVVMSSNIATRRDGLPYANQSRIEDPGVVLYFRRKGQDIAIPCDRWHTVDANLRAIGLQIESIRRIERWGTEQMMDRAFTGYAALPANAGKPTAPRAWYEVLQLSPDADQDIIKAAYRKLASKYHPDNHETADEQKFLEVQQAFKEATS